ncbi:hypothetical protein GOODEAATRI_031365, partial [Goodea atripinnis]
NEEDANSVPIEGLSVQHPQVRDSAEAACSEHGTATTVRLNIVSYINHMPKSIQ